MVKFAKTVKIAVDAVFDGLSYMTGALSLFLLIIWYSGHLIITEVVPNHVLLITVH